MFRWLMEKIRSNCISLKSGKFPSGVPQGSVISPTLFLNELLCLTSNPIYLFEDDSSLCHSYNYNAHHNLNEVGESRNYMDDTLNSDPLKI